MQTEVQVELLTPAEVAAMLRIDIRTMRALGIPFIKLGRLYRYAAADVRALIETKSTPLDQHIRHDSALLMAGLIAFDAKQSTTQQ